MSSTSVFDVIVVGGGMAGSTLSGVLARAGLGVLVLEKEERFRDRVRGESTWPYAVADALAMGLQPLLEMVGTVEITGVRRYANQEVASTYRWAEDSLDHLPEMGFYHPRFQEAALEWAASQGVTVMRPAKAIGFSHNGRPAG